MPNTRQLAVFTVVLLLGLVYSGAASAEGLLLHCRYTWVRNIEDADPGKPASAAQTIVIEDLAEKGTASIGEAAASPCLRFGDMSYALNDTGLALACRSRDAQHSISIDRVTGNAAWVTLYDSQERFSTSLTGRCERITERLF